MEAYINAHIVPMTPDNTVYSMMVVHEGTIRLLTNSKANVPRNIDCTIDCENKTIVPGFFDTHVHFLATGYCENLLNLRKCGSFDELFGAIRSEYEEKSPRMLLGFGLSEVRCKERRLPDKTELDDILPKKIPIILIKYDSHAIVCNSAAMTFLKISPFMDGFSRNGYLTKMALDYAIKRISDQVPLTDIFRSLIKASNLAIQSGTTTIDAMEGHQNARRVQIEALKHVRRALPIDLEFFYQTTCLRDALNVRHKRIGGCIDSKIDGSIGTKTAAFLEPYLSKNPNIPPNFGTVYFNEKAAAIFVSEAVRNNMQVTVHAVGDRAIEIALNSYQWAFQEYNRTSLRPRLEHVFFPTASQIRRLAALNIIVATQPAFLQNPALPVSAVQEFLGADRLKRFMPLKSMLKAGITLIGGSDSPMNPINPLLGIHAACNHPNPDESISPLEALKMYTVNAAFGMKLEKNKGTLEEGKDADFVILDKDPLAVSAQTLKDIQIDSVYIKGERISLQNDSPWVFPYYYLASYF